MNSLLFRIAFGVLLFSTGLQAAVRLPAIISDHMVLQAGGTAAVWGWADPGEQVTVSVAGQSKSATAGADGKWRVQLDKLDPSSQPQTLTVAGTNTLTVNDVLIGEVWLGSGQSNMALRVQGTLNSEAEIAAANHPLIRLFTVRSDGSATPQDNCVGVWQICSPETVGLFSATSYYFGRELHKALGTPVGLINSSVGGTRIEAWTSAEAQKAAPELKERVAEYEQAAASFNPEAAKAKYEKDLAAWKVKADTIKASGGTPPRAPMDPIASRSKQGRELGMLFNGKIAPLIPFGIRGAIWYQGEANSQPGRAELYEKQLPILIQDWRARWGCDFAFAWVQLVNFDGGPGRDWPVIREGMLKTLKVKNTGMAIAIDIGEANNIHPINKPEVGRRLGLWALGSVYGQKVPTVSGPLPAGHEIRGSEIAVSFQHADQGLKARDGELKGFVIASDDRQWKPATAKIEGNTVIVSNPDVKQPAAVRYAWENNPDCNLYNGAGLPASPFRTDDWKDPVSQTAPAAADAKAETPQPAQKPQPEIPVAPKPAAPKPSPGGTGNTSSAGGANLLKNSDFSSPINKSMGRGEWILTVMNSDRAKPFATASSGYSIKNGTLELDMAELNPEQKLQRNMVRLGQFVSALSPARRYQLSFEARASEPGIIRVAVGVVTSGNGDTEGGLPIQQVDLGAEFKPYQYDFAPAELVSNKADPQKFTRVEFRLGETQGKIFFRNIRLVEFD